MPKLSFFVLLVAIVFAPVAHAQEPTLSPEEKSITDLITSVSPSPAADVPTTTLPLIYAQDLTVVAGENNTITGAFTALSQEEKSIVSGLQYEVLVLSPAPSLKDDELTPDNPTFYARVIPPDLFSLKPGESSQRSFTISTPPLPAGDYRVRVQMRTANDREMGWADAVLALQGVNYFAILEPQSVEVSSTDPVTGVAATSWAPMEGVNVTPSQALTIKVIGKNASTTPITAPLTTTTRRLFNQNPVVTTVLPEPVTIPAGATAHNLTIPITAATIPGAYQLLITLKPEAGTAVSSIAEVRYVVTGVSASIISAKLTTPAVQKGEVATVDFTVVGSADRQTTHQGKLTVELLDETTVVGTTTEDIELASGAVSGTATVELTTAVLKHLALKLIVTTSTGATLATYEVHYPELKGTADAATPTGAAGAFTMSPYILWGAIAGGVIIVLAILSWLLYRRRRRPLILPPVPPPAGGSTPPAPPAPPATPKAPTALLVAAVALGVAGLLAATMPTNANGIQIRYRYSTIPNYYPGISVFINSPQHNSTIKTGAKVPYEVRLTWDSCSNQASYSSVLIMSQQGHTQKVNVDKPPRYGWNANSNFNNTFIGARIDFRLSTSCSNFSGFYNRLTCVVDNEYSLSPQWRAHTFQYRTHASEAGHPIRNYAYNLKAALVLAASKAGNGGTILTRGEVARIPTTTSMTLETLSDFTWVTFGNLTQCKDTTDNDGDKLIDAADPGCHTDGNASNPASYDPNDKSETDPPATTTPPPVLRPDLTVQNVSPSSTTIVAGDTITFSGTIVNSGQAAAGASQAQFFRNYPNPSGSAVQTGALGVGATEQVSGPWVATAGTYTIRLCADNTGLVTESNELNNCSADVSFTVAAKKQCSDGIDNDGDGATDSGDFSCSDSNDDDETNPKSQCQDGIDNDDPKDGLADFGSGSTNDPSCDSLQDNDETNTTATTPQCSDGIDNDDPKDGLADFGSGSTNDPGCTSATDNDESNTGVGGVKEVD